MSSTEINTDMTRHPLGEASPQGGSNTVLAFHRHYLFPPERVWAAITDPEETEKWWAASRGRLAPGERFELRWLNGRDEELEWWPGEVVAVEPPRLLEITNREHGSIRFELTEADADGLPGTWLTFTNVISAEPEQVRMSLAGWHVHLDHLQEALEGRRVDWARWHDDVYPAWEAVYREYTDAAG
ncbi:SRPBCC family protein [Georgenia sp. AZ-5]|uniref:SRPBCC family protein n=1 Tax=Georgenia sp. AZ-5 TaxID=3367526 RepID=UPI0037550801